MIQQHCIRALEERAFNAWPARQSVFCGGWVLRLSGGLTKRANSANALAPKGAFSDIKATAEALYARHSLPTIFRLTPLAPKGTDEVLAEAGYKFLDPTIVMTAALEDDSNDHGVTISATPTPEWCAGFAAANNVVPGLRPVHDRMVAAIALPAAFATIADAGAPIGYGLAVTDRGMTGLFDIVVVEAARGRGVGRKLTTALLHWGRSQGADRAYLQVVASNKDAYRYHYRIGP
jgi:GNAT superfamily N-acetyltransferase